MKKQVLAQISDGKLINLYETPDEATIDGRNRYNAHEIRMAILNNTTYKGFEWKWIDVDKINTSKTITQER